jgi:hypothetical protein
MNPLILAAITLVVGGGIGWSLGSGNGKKAGAEEARAEIARSGGGYKAMNSGAATGDASATGVAGDPKANAPKQVAEEDKKIFTAEADTLFKKLLADLESGENVNPMELMNRIQQLKGMGEEGLRVMADFLKSNEDIELQGGDRGGPGGFRSPTLRLALLGALRGEKSETAKAASLYVLQSSPYISEVGMAAWNLNDSWPDEYKAQIDQQMKSLINGLSSNTELSEDQKRRESFAAMMYVSRNGSTDLLPALEGQFAAAGGRELGMYLNTLNNMSPEAQSESLARMASNPATAAKLVENGGQIARLNMSTEANQNTAVSLYNQMSANEQEDFLEAYRGGRRGGGDRGFGGGGRRWGGGGNESTPEQQIASAQGSLAVLGKITPTTPVQQQLHSEAIQNLNSRIERLKNPAPPQNN